MTTYQLRAGLTPASVGIIFIDSTRTLDLSRQFSESATMYVPPGDTNAKTVLDNMPALQTTTDNPSANEARYLQPVLALVPFTATPDDTLTRRSDGDFELASSPGAMFGGGNLVDNPSFYDGLTGYSVSGGTVTLETVAGVYGASAARATKTTSTGTLSLTAPSIDVKTLTAYTFSAWSRLSTLGTTTPRLVTISVAWYDVASSLLRTDTSSAVEQPIDGTPVRVSLQNVLSPSSAATAVMTVAVASVPALEEHIFDAYQAEVGPGLTGYNAHFGESSFPGTVLAPETLTTREISTDLIDDIVADVAANAAPVGRFDFPVVVDPRMGAANGTFTANNVYYFRVEGRGTITKIAIHIGTTDAAGTVVVGVNSNTGSGRAARPSALVTSGSLSTAAGGYKEITLGASVDVAHGDWFSFTTNSSTASFLRTVANATTNVADGLAHSQTGGGGTSIPSTPGTLFSQLSTPVMVGVA